LKNLGYSYAKVMSFSSRCVNFFMCVSVGMQILTLKIRCRYYKYHSKTLNRNAFSRHLVHLYKCQPHNSTNVLLSKPNRCRNINKFSGSISIGTPCRVWLGLYSHCKKDILLQNAWTMFLLLFSFIFDYCIEVASHKQFYYSIYSHFPIFLQLLKLNSWTPISYIYPIL